MTEVDGEHLGMLVACTVRYALGRRSYMVRQTCMLVRVYWGRLSPHWRRVIRRDVRHEVQECEDAGLLVGDRMDHEQWRCLLRWIEQH